MRKVWHETAWEDYVVYQSQDHETLNRINSLVKSIERNGYAAIGLCLGFPAGSLRLPHAKVITREATAAH